jgi:putrescine transport system ATP-binding protein
MAAVVDKPGDDAAGCGDTSSDAYVCVRGVSKVFDGFVAVDNIDLTIRKGEIFALLGSSGCGKTTLLRMLAGFEQPTEGRIYLDGVDMSAMPPYRRPVNMMFQSYALFPHMTVEQNVAFGLKQERLPKARIAEQVADVLKLVQMQRFAKRKPHQLSGGQRQRVALARSLVKRPKLLLLDEPMAALDKKLREQTRLELVNILESVGVTCVMVTHDQEEAMTMAWRIAVMSEGQIMQLGTPSEIYEHPNSRFSANFIGSVNLFEGRISEDEPDYVVIECPELDRPIYIGHGITGTVDMQVWVALRPEKLVISREQPDDQYNWTQGKVADIAYLGGHSVYHVEIPSGKDVIANVLNLNRDAASRPTWDDEVYVSWVPTSGVVLKT